MNRPSTTCTGRLKRARAVVAAAVIVALSAIHPVLGARGQSPAPEWIPATDSATYPDTNFYNPAAPPPIAGTEVVTDRQAAQIQQTLEKANIVGATQTKIHRGKMLSDTVGLPSGFDKRTADEVEVSIATETNNSEQHLLRSVEAYCKSFWPSPYQVCGGILAKYERLGGATSWLMAPIEPETLNPDGVGYHQRFIGGFIYWHPDTGAYAVANHTASVWQRHNWEAGWLGYPITDETPTTGAGSFEGAIHGWVQEFEGGRIYRSPILQGFRIASINGLILKKWLQLGGPASALGFPIADEAKTADGIGRFSVFQNGTIYWHPNHGAHPVSGAVHYNWNARGAESSGYGYPVEDPTISDEGLEEQEFENGSLVANPDDILLPFYCLAAATRVASEAGLNQEYIYTCLPNGIYVDGADGTTYFSLPSLQDILNPEDIFSLRSSESLSNTASDSDNVCNSPVSKISTPLRRDDYRVSKTISICLGERKLNGQAIWEEELSWEMTNVLQQRRWSEVQIRMINTILPEFEFTAYSRLRRDRSYFPDGNMEIPDIVVNGPTTRTIREQYETPKSAGTYFVEFAGMHLEIPARGYDRYYNGPKFAIGRYICDEYSDEVTSCRFPNLIDDHT